MRIGIDLGGTKIECIALDNRGETLKRHRVSTPANDYRRTLKAITDLVTEFEQALEPATSVGIGMPGAISMLTGKVKNSNSVCLNGQPFKEDIESMLQRKINIENDANCFALSEAIDGAAQDAALVFGVILGTGVGGGIVINGKVINGPNAIAGEWGHNPLPWPDQSELPGHLCYCGKSGCIETWLSGAGLTRAYQQMTGQLQSADTISELARQGDEHAELTLSSYETRLAKSLASVINILDPTVIVLGGGLSNIQRLYNNVPGIWSRYVFSDQVKTRLYPAKFGDSSGVRGAAWL